MTQNKKISCIQKRKLLLGSFLFFSFLYSLFSTELFLENLGFELKGTIYQKTISASLLFGVPRRREPKTTHRAKYLKIRQKEFLDKLAVILNSSKYSLEIIAYAQGDNRWKKKRGISKIYAKKIASYLQSKGVPTKVLKPLGYGWRKYGLILFRLKPIEPLPN
ncbi:MAG: hypothetical protein D6767_04985 [Candidatus Hydrogenedentota bacterium]|nr:MAG: hypothetical protein D6767_04985 [Candidatus Hydrogenedentota bacterium]